LTHSRIACGAHCLTIPLRLTIPPRPRVPYVSCAPAWPRVVAHCTGRVLDTQHVRGASTKVSELVNCSRLALVERQVQVYLRRKGLRTKRCCTFPGFLFFEGLEGAPMGPGNDHSSSRSSLSGTLRLAPSSCRAGASQPRRATESLTLLCRTLHGFDVSVSGSEERPLLQLPLGPTTSRCWRCYSSSSRPVRPTRIEHRRLSVVATIGRAPHYLSIIGSCPKTLR